MKQLFLYVMIFSLLLGVCGCSHEIDPQQETGTEGVELSDNSTQGTEQEPETPTVQGEGENVTPEEPPETPPIETPEIVPPETPPIIEPPETEPSETPPIEEPPITPPEIIPPSIAILLINELRTEYSSSSKRAEYIEFKAIASGNLQGISVHIMFDGNNPFVYYFPAVNVALGEYITLHLRTLENNCIDELGDNLALSGGNDSCPTARDLWVAGSKKYLHQTDIVYLQIASGRIIDAIIMNEKPSIEWNKSQAHFAAIAEFLCSMGAWEYEDDKPTAFDAVDTSAIGQSLYKSVCRYEWRANHFNTTDWYVTTSGFTSAGLANK